MAAEVREGAPEQVEAVMSSMLTQLLTEASDLLLAPGVLERAQSLPVLGCAASSSKELELCLGSSKALHGMRPCCMR